MNLRSIREALAEAFAVHGYRVYSTLPEQGELPLVAISWPDRVQYHTSLTGGTRVEMVATVAVGLNDFAKAQRDLDDLMSTPGLVDKLDLTSNDHWWEASVIEAGNVRQINVGVQGLAVDFVIEIHTD